MLQRFQFSTTALLKATVGLAIACFIMRLAVKVSADVPLSVRNIFYLVAASTFVLAPFIAVGAIFDRVRAGLLWGVTFIIVMTALLRGL